MLYQQTERPFTSAKDKSFERPSFQIVEHLNEYV